MAEIVGPDLLIVLVIAALVIFGGTRIPKLARALGSSAREFRKGMEGEGEEGEGSAAAPKPPVSEEKPPKG